MIAEGTNKYEHASFLIFVSYFYKIKFFEEHLFCVLFEKNLENFNISIIKKFSWWNVFSKIF